MRKFKVEHLHENWSTTIELPDSERVEYAVYLAAHKWLEDKPLGTVFSCKAIEETRWQIGLNGDDNFGWPRRIP